VKPPPRPDDDALPLELERRVDAVCNRFEAPGRPAGGFKVSVQEACRRIAARAAGRSFRREPHGREHALPTGHRPGPLVGRGGSGSLWSPCSWKMPTPIR
jgi:hypothetical protein